MLVVQYSSAGAMTLKHASDVQITSVDEAKTFYPLFGLGANVALIFSGRAVKYFSEVRPIFLQARLHAEAFQFGPSSFASHWAQWLLALQPSISWLHLPGSTCKLTQHNFASKSPAH